MGQGGAMDTLESAWTCSTAAKGRHRHPTLAGPQRTQSTPSSFSCSPFSLAASLVMYELAKGLNSLEVYANDLSNQPASLANGQAVEQVTAALLICLQRAGLHNPARQHRSKADERLRRIIMRSRMSAEEAKWLQRTIENLLPFVQRTP